MFGDPLHFLVVFADGAAWAWDLKFLLAKWLFASGLGLIVWRLTRHLPSATLMAFSSAFIGFFVFRINHPAFFSVCYAPWILYCWIRLTQGAALRPALGWVGGLLLANWAELNSGTVKEAYMLLAGLNLTGAILLAWPAPAAGRAKLRTFGVLLAAGGVFALLSAPIWLTFLDTLRQAYTSYDQPWVYQIQPGMILGLFDEIFYRPLQKHGAGVLPLAQLSAAAGRALLSRHAAPRRARPSHPRPRRRRAGAPVPRLRPDSVRLDPGRALPPQRVPRRQHLFLRADHPPHSAGRGGFPCRVAAAGHGGGPRRRRRGASAAWRAGVQLYRLRPGGAPADLRPRRQPSPSGSGAITCRSTGLSGAACGRCWPPP